MRWRHAVCVTLLSLFIPAAVAASTAGAELYISPQGNVHFRRAELALRHAKNLLSIRVWGQRWVVETTYATRFEAASGAEIDSEEILEGHVLDLIGRITTAQLTNIEARVVRDLSLAKELPPGASPSPAALHLPATIAQLSLDAPPPAGNTAPGSTPRPTPPLAPPPPPPPPPLPAPPAEPLITLTLKQGMRGQEVILLQRFLRRNDWGIPDNGSVTGYFGRVTGEALRNFQKTNGISETGETDATTRRLLNAVIDL